MPFGHPCRHSLWSASEALGDACMPFRKGQPVLCIKFEQNRSKADYIQHLYDRATQRPPNDLRAPTLALAVGRPGRDTLLAHLHKYGIFVVVALGIDNLFGCPSGTLWSIRIQILCCPSGSQPMARFNTEGGP